jgi:uncharacterized membrane protein
VPSPEQRKAAGQIAAVALAIGLIVMVYPHLANALLTRFGVRPSCTVLFALTALSLALGRRRSASVEIPRWPGIAIAAVLGWGSLTGERSGLLMLPAIVYLAVADFFRLSLKRADSILERGARWIVPEAPDFIRAYCRGLTWFWAALLAAAAAVSAGLALASSSSCARPGSGTTSTAAPSTSSGRSCFRRRTPNGVGDRRSTSGASASRLP